MKKEEPFIPDYIFNSILDLTPEFLTEHGIKGVLCDTDNTLALDNRKDIIPEAREWVKIMDNAGIKVCLLSNSFYVRNHTIIKDLNLKYWHTRAHKPRPRNYLLMCERMGLKKEEVCMLGDQMLTDISGANNVDMLSVYVMPYAFETNPFYKNIFRKRRARERKFIKKYNELHGTQFDFPEHIKAEMHPEDVAECIF